MFNIRVVIKQRIVHVLLLVLLFYVAPIPASNPQEPVDEIVFGVLPFLSTEKLFARFTPLADYLSIKLGKPVRLETAKDFATFLHRTSNEKRYDLLFTAPHFYYHAQRKAGYRVIVRDASAGLQAIIVVPKDSDIASISDLKGRSMATADPLALATMMVRDYLFKAGINPDRDIKSIPAPNHIASLLLSYKGVTDASALMSTPFRLANREIQQAMRIIATTDMSPHIPISVAASMDKQLADKIQAVLLGMNHDKDGKKLMKSMKSPGFVNAAPALYDSLKWAAEQLE